MEDPALRRHKYFRLVYDMILEHPDRDDLTALHGTILVRGGNPISLALNSPRRTEFSDHYATHASYTIHSELNAVRRARKKIDLTGCVAYNLRLDKNGLVRLSAPCPGCTKLFMDYGIKKCFYSTNSGEIECLKLNSILPQLSAA